MLLDQLQKAIFSVDKNNFETTALEIFRYQSQNCEVYRQYLQLLQTDLTKIIKLEDIPYLPIEFFKYFSVTTDNFIPERIFESSSTTGKGVSKHAVRSLNWYEECFTGSFNSKFNNPSDHCHLALLPAYLERENSSLVYQVNHFIEHSKYPQSGFYLQNFDELSDQILQNEAQKIPTLLWGVTFALLDFAEKYHFDLRTTTIIETGGMKGRRKEIIREELHQILKKAFGQNAIAGEYGMTELMSQAYSKEDGVFNCPAWMHSSGREINDPLSPPVFGRNSVLNIIDLANIHTCCFIATSDIATVQKDGSFRVLGRLDNSDTRGCNLLV